MKLPLFFQTFRPLLSRLKLSGPILLIVLWIATLVWIWWQGADYSIDNYKPLETLTRRWLVTAVMIIIAISWIAWRMSKRLNQLEKRQQEDKKNQHSPVQEDIDAQRRYLDRWVVRFKRYLEVPEYHYALPWYLSLSADESGNTSLLTKGADFVELYETDEESTSQVEFSIFTNGDAVIISPNSNLISQVLEVEHKPKLYSKLWNNLLDWIVEQRKRQPLNGIILTVDFYELLTSSKEKRDAYVETLQQRLQDIFNKVNSELPIYVVMTKLDRLSGFQVMYDKLTKEQREAILGTTFSGKGEHWQDELSTFWDNWCQQMNSAMPDMLLSIQSEQRGNVFSFIRQVNGAYEDVSKLLTNLLATIGKSSYFPKGLYFTSALQSGRIDDLFVQSSSEQFNLGQQTYSTWSNKVSYSYFCKELFENVLFSYPNIASESRVWKVSYEKTFKASLILGGLAAIGILFGWQYYYKQNHDAGVAVLEQIKAFKNVPVSTEKDYLGDKQLPLLNPVRDAVLKYGDYKDNSTIFTDMGLYQGNKMGPYVSSTYWKLLQFRFLPAIMNGLQRELDNAPENSNEKLEILRVMRMLDDKSGRSDQVVEDFMRKYWSNVFRGQSQLQANLLSHLDYALKNTDWYAGRKQGNQEMIEAFKPYDLSIRNAQKELSNLSIYERVYQNLKSNSKSVYPTDLDYREEIGSGYDDLFSAIDTELLRIPRFFTTEGLTNYFVKRDSQLIKLTAIDSWVLNLSANVEYSDADRQEISNRVSEQYVNEYIATWNNALDNLDIKRFEDIPQAVKAIERVTGSSQSMKRAIATVNANTSAASSPNGVEGKALESLLASPEFVLRNQISNNFVNEKNILAQDDGRDSILQNVYPSLSNLHRYLLAIQNSPEKGKAALRAVQMRVDQQSTDPIIELQQLAKTVPEPLGRWLEQIADNAWKAVLKSAVIALEVEWNNKVVKPYKATIEGRYPFAPSASQEVAISDFDRFFAPDGIIDGFYNKYLSAFIDNDIMDDSEEGKSFLREDVIEQFELARRIRDTFFSSENGLGAQYIVEPVSLAANKRRSVLNLDGQIIDFTHGNKKRVNVVWPNSMNVAVESKLTLVPNKVNTSPRSISFRGPWAQIKLFNSGKIISNKDGAFDIRYDVDGGYATYRVYVDSSDNPFSSDMFRRFKLQETLY